MRDDESLRKRYVTVKAQRKVSNRSWIRPIQTLPNPYTASKPSVSLNKLSMKSEQSKLNVPPPATSQAVAF